MKRMTRRIMAALMAVVLGGAAGQARALNADEPDCQCNEMTCYSDAYENYCTPRWESGCEMVGELICLSCSCGDPNEPPPCDLTDPDCSR
jgi:hypothetical protein